MVQTTQPPFRDWIDAPVAAERQHAEIARITGIGTGRMLEIGSGDGAYLKYYQDRGWECLGVEADEAKYRRALDNQILTLQGDIGEVNIPQRSYDIVRIRGTLGASNDPEETLRAAFEAAYPTRYLIAEVGHGWPLPFFGSSNRQVERRFTKRSLKAMVESVGFEVGGMIAPPLGDPIWAPLTPEVTNLRGAAIRRLDSILGYFDQGSLLVLFAQRPPDDRER